MLIWLFMLLFSACHRREEAATFGELVPSSPFITLISLFFIHWQNLFLIVSVKNSSFSTSTLSHEFPLGTSSFLITPSFRVISFYPTLSIWFPVNMPGSPNSYPLAIVLALIWRKKNSNNGYIWCIIMAIEHSQASTTGPKLVAKSLLTKYYWLERLLRQFFRRITL